MKRAAKLEFEHGAGFAAGFATVAARRYRHAVVVVRPELLARALARWPWAGNIYTLTPLQESQKS